MAKNALRPTLKTVAMEAGVTANTVSLALRGSPLVAPATREKVLAAARKQGYVHNMLASSLRMGQSKTIALVFGDIGNLLFAIKMKKLEKLFRGKGYQILILNTNESAEQEYDAIRAAISRKIDGVVWTPSCKEGKAHELLEQHRIPHVLVGRSLDEETDDCVLWDNETGGRMATDYLFDHGCRSVLYLADRFDSISTERERYAGYARSMAAHGFGPGDIRRRCVIRGSRRIEDAMAAVDVAYDGIFCFRDQLAWELATLPGVQARLIGFDNIQATLKIPVHIPSIGTDLDEEAAAIAKLLLARIEDPTAQKQHIVLPVFVAEH